MGRLRVVKRQVIRGAKGPKGDPGVNAIPADDFIAERLLDPESETSDAGGQVYAAKSAQDAIETGRLNEGILTNRFGQPSVYIPASSMILALGTPAQNIIFGMNPTWNLDDAVNEGVSFAVQIPKEWAEFDVTVRGVNIFSGATGNVRLVCQHLNGVADGENITSGLSTGAGVVITAAAQNIKTSAKLRTGLTNNGTKVHIFRVYRDAVNVADTLTDDWGLLGVELTATKYVQFAPTLPPAPEELTGRTFTEAMNAELDGTRVWRFAVPPANDLDPVGYKNWPGTDLVSRQNFSSSTWSGNKGAMMWTNRYNFGDAWNKRANPMNFPRIKIGTRECRVVYTSREKAIAATRAQVRHVVGMSAASVEAAWTAAGGVAGDILTEATWRADPETYCPDEFTYNGEVFRVMTDKVVLTDLVLDAEDTSVVIDYEPQDSRTPTQTTTAIQDLITDCHSVGKELFLYTNPLSTGLTSTANGFDSTNLPTILDAVDQLGILLWVGAVEGSFPASWTSQIARLGTMTTARWAKIVIIHEVAPTSTIEDAEWVYFKLHESGSNHPTQVMFWTDQTALGGSANRLTNRVISMVCFGSETPPTP